MYFHLIKNLFYVDITTMKNNFYIYIYHKMAFNSKFAFLLILLSISFTFQHGGHMSEDDVKETPLSKFLTFL